MSEASEHIKELEDILKDLEAAEHPDFETIADVQTQIDELKASAGVSSESGESGESAESAESGKVELDSFDDWASESSGRYEDSDSYGDLQSFNSGQSPSDEPAPPAPAPKIETASFNEPQGSGGLSDEMDKVMCFLIESVVVKSYQAVTFKGKKKLTALVKAAIKSGGPSPVGRLSFNIKRWIDKAFGQLNYSPDDKNQIIFHLVLSLDDKIYAIEHRDVGASRILKSLIAKEHLPGELYKKLDAKGTFN